MNSTPTIPPFSSFSLDSHTGRNDQAVSYLALAFGPKGLGAAEEFLACASSSTPTSLCTVSAADTRVIEAFRATLGRARVGLRILLAGPEADVYAARSVALEAGAVESEILLSITEAVSRRVYCPHCTSTTVTDAAIGRELECSRCHRALVIDQHFSRRTASYLGYMSAAEEVPQTVECVAA